MNNPPDEKNIDHGTPLTKEELVRLQEEAATKTLPPCPDQQEDNG